MEILGFIQDYQNSYTGYTLITTVDLSLDGIDYVFPYELYNNYDAPYVSESEYAPEGKLLIAISDTARNHKGVNWIYSLGANNADGFEIIGEKYGVSILLKN